MSITNIQGGKGRFDGCTTTEEMATRLRKGEYMKSCTYGGGSQIEVRVVKNGIMRRVATAHPV